MVYGTIIMYVDNSITHRRMKLTVEEFNHERAPLVLPQTPRTCSQKPLAFHTKIPRSAGFFGKNRKYYNVCIGNKKYKTSQLRLTKEHIKKELLQKADFVIL